MKKCRVCKDEFHQRLPLQTVCGLACAQSLAVSIRGKAAKVAQVRERKADAALRKQQRPLSYWADQAQVAVNAWIRLRDEGLPCISCGKHHTGQYHAGHFLSRGARPEIRFNELNLNRQCSPCNLHLSGNAVLYRIGLIAKIGVEQVEWLEGPHPLNKYTADDYRAIKAEYTAKTRILKEQQA